MTVDDFTKAPYNNACRCEETGPCRARDYWRENNHEKTDCHNAGFGFDCRLSGGCSGTSDAGSQNAVDADKMSQTQTAKAPKYVFLFIGDGMSYPQIQSTSDYLGALKDEDYWAGRAQPGRQPGRQAGWP